jgi:hypothetical protein
MVVLEKFKDEEYVYLSLFGRGLNIKRYNFLARIRHIWQILTKGFPYTDEIVLDKKGVKKLIDSLNRFYNCIR